MTTPEPSKFAVPLADLERVTRVPREQLVEERPEADVPHEPRQTDPPLLNILA